MKNDDLNLATAGPTDSKFCGIPVKLSPAGQAERTRSAAAKANRLPPEEQMSRFLQWLKIKDGGHQPC